MKRFHLRRLTSPALLGAAGALLAAILIFHWWAPLPLLSAMPSLELGINAPLLVLAAIAMLAAWTTQLRHRETQQRLEDNERRLHELLDSIPAMVGHFNRDELCLFGNEMALKYHGFTRESAVGRRLKDAITPEAYALHKPHVDQALLGHRARFDHDLQLGSVSAHFQVNLVPERDKSGQVCGFYLMTFNVSALKRAKVELERSEARLRAITDNLPVLISYIDREQRLQFTNKTFEAWTGIPVASAHGQPLRDMLGEVFFAERHSPLTRALEGERVEFEVESQESGQPRFLQTLYVPDQNESGPAKGVYELTTDVTALRLAERRMAGLALNDPLTGLANRRRFDERLIEVLARTHRHTTAAALMFLDVDRFKQINDTFGHAAGDAVLIDFGARLLASVRETDFVARLAGDEFVVLLEDLHRPEECEAIAAKVVEAVQPVTLFEGHELSVTVSIGIAYFTADTELDAAAVLKVADDALYETKRQGRNGYTCALADTALADTRATGPAS